jgi:Amt family ammonium transporter
VGVFATTAVNAAGANGLIHGNATLLGKQLLGAAVVSVFSFVMTFVLATAVKAVIGFRVNEVEERVGLDISQHGERSYGGLP